MPKGEVDNQICVLCGKRPATTKDHVPPRAVFLKPRPNDMIKVPSCFICNNKSSKADKEFSMFVCANATIAKGDSSSALYKQKLVAPLRHNNRLRNQVVVDAKKVELRTNNGIYLGGGYTTRWSAKAHTNVIQRITRGLYYHHFNEILPQEIKIESYWYGYIDEKLESAAATLKKSSIGGKSFIYSYGRAHDAPHESIWFYQFHNAHFAGASTGE